VAKTRLHAAENFSDASKALAEHGKLAALLRLSRHAHRRLIGRPLVATDVT
jgi:hypothetical protein